MPAGPGARLISVVVYGSSRPRRVPGSVGSLWPPAPWKVPMSRTLSLALASAASLALLAPAAAAVPAPTDANEPDGAAAAAAYVATKVAEDGSLGDPGLTADVVLETLAAGGHPTYLRTDYLESRAIDYAGSGSPAAGKMALVAAATGRDATSFGGVDLVAKINESVQA